MNLIYVVQMNISNIPWITVKSIFPLCVISRWYDKLTLSDSIMRTWVTLSDNFLSRKKYMGSVILLRSSINVYDFIWGKILMGKLLEKRKTGNLFLMRNIDFNRNIHKLFGILVTQPQNTLFGRNLMNQNGNTMTLLINLQNKKSPYL